MKHILVFLVCFGPLPLAAGFFSSDVVILGEIHDNPHHHARQAELIAQITPTAVVFEMLTPEEAARLDAVARDPSAMGAAAAGVGWANMLDYAEVLAASPRILGAALAPEEVRRAFAEDAATVFGHDAARFGLDVPVPDDQLAQRMQMQFDAHCEALPMEMMGGMVEAQRLRDAAFARAIAEALQVHGAPIVLITGNGHARTDWGVPAYLEAALEGATIHALGQGEDGAPLDAPFDAVEYSSPAERGDPCDAFR